MYAVVEAGGQQFKVAPGDVIKIPRAVPGDKNEIILDRVLMISKDDDIVIGRPYIKSASVKAEVQGEYKSPKILVFKQKTRKGHRKLRGHRQGYTVVKISDIGLGG